MTQAINLTFNGSVDSAPSAVDGIVLFFNEENLKSACPAWVAGADKDTIAQLIERKVFSAKAKSHILVPGDGVTYVLVGLGKEKSLCAELCRRSMGSALKSIAQHRLSSLALIAEDNASAYIEAIALGQYSFERYKTKPSETVTVTSIVLPELSTEKKTACENALTTALCANWARDLGNTPGNDMTPTAMADAAAKMASAYDGVDVDILDEKKMRALGMGAILAVSQGSREEARLITLHYKHDKNSPTVGLVGKGVSFDTGGISIKPSAGMQEMKYDMCGAAAVLGAFKAVCELKPAVNVVCIVASAENMPGEAAIKPGDIIKTYAGKTVEIYNTDAEGRLVLADGLAYMVDKYKPKAIVDAATLTGACIVALGHSAAAVISNDDDVVASLQVAADSTGERIWRMPAWDDYAETMNGNDADLGNMSQIGREAGAITAGCFLQNFVGDTPWAHVDIAGTAWNVKGVDYLPPKLATGYGVRLFSQWVASYA